MNGRQRRPRIKLSPDQYASMRNLVLERDGWRCQKCGTFYNLQVHHLQPRSKLGSDALANLMTLCADCHHVTHGR
jgi:5-methylcytosine-specific restriction endonuclease McrA